MRSVLVIFSIILVASVKSQNLSFENICHDSSFAIYNIDINKDAVKDKVAYNRNGNDLIFYTLIDSLYRIVYRGDNYSMDGIYSLVQIESYTEDDNVLYVKNVFNGAGGQTIEYFLSYKNNNWQLSHSIINSTTFDRIKICQITYSGENKIEEFFDCKKNKGSVQNEINLELSNNINKYSSIITNELIFSILKISPVSLDNITSYNNLAYYLEQCKKYKEAIYLLSKIIKGFQNRTVAYINLGDAYWGLEENSKAKEAYSKYIALMKANGKENKIPQRIFERIK